MTHLEQHLRQCHRITFQQANVRAVQIVYLHGVNYVQDLWKVLSQDSRVSGPGGLCVERNTVPMGKSRDKNRRAVAHRQSFASKWGPDWS